MQNVFRRCALGAGIAALFAASALNAVTFQSKTVSIPFAFRVSKLTLPAGEYRVNQNYGSDITYLVNLKTGQQVQILRSGGGQLQDRARLVFENTSNGYVLKTIL
jgi:hypothetical protein